MQSIAERCASERIALASFFFFRSDSTRNTVASLIATIVYQLVQNIPQAQEEIFAIIESNPLIFDQSLESQLKQLVIEPLLRFKEHFHGLFVILVDGLDECTGPSHQLELIKLLGSVSHSVIPVIFLIASRRELQIEAAFVHKQVSDLVLTLPLDKSDVEQTSDDIRRFLNDKFDEIKANHLRRTLLPANWPPVSEVEDIVVKSSGQFIYASVVISYVSSPRTNPAHRLEVVRGIRLQDALSQNPFAHLDALYQYIFSQVEALDRVLDILAFLLLSNITSIQTIEAIFMLASGELAICLADLTTVIRCESHTDARAVVKFLHASLPDFLLDKSRSEAYHINPDEYRTKLLCMFLERPPQVFYPPVQKYDGDVMSYNELVESSRLVAIWALTRGAKASDRLHDAYMKLDFIFHSTRMVKESSVILQYLKNLVCFDTICVCPRMLIPHYELCQDFNDHGQVYRHVLDMFAAEYAKNWSSLDNKAKDRMRKHSPDLLARISEIRQ